MVPTLLPPSQALLLAVLVVAVVIDQRTRRIPNALSLGALLAALLLAAAGWSALPLPTALAGAATGFALLLPLYALRAMGAGDVKLMTAVGAFLGPALTLGAVLGTFIAGALVSAVALLRRRRTAVPAADGSTGQRVPYALAILAGVLSALVFAPFWQRVWAG